MGTTSQTANKLLTQTSRAAFLIAAELTAAVGKNGIIFRMRRGREFVIFLPDASIEQTLLFARAVCLRTETAKIIALDNAPMSVTVSAGMACRRGYRLFKALYAEADCQLYRA